jgi:hypothetical protein
MKPVCSPQNARMTGIRLIQTTLMALLVLSSFAVGDEGATRDRRHRQILDRRTVIFESFAEDMENVAEWCRQRRLVQAASEISSLQQKLTQSKERPEPPRLLSPEISQSLSSDELSWRSQVRKARQDRAAQLYTLARSALRAGFR